MKIRKVISVFIIFLFTVASLPHTALNVFAAQAAVFSDQFNDSNQWSVVFRDPNNDTYTKHEVINESGNNVLKITADTSTATGTRQRRMAAGDTNWTDYKVSYRAKFGPGSEFIEAAGAIVRQNGSNYYAVQYFSFDGLTILKNTGFRGPNGSYIKAKVDNATLTGLGVNVRVWNQYKVEVVGNTIRVFINNIVKPVLEWTDNEANPNKAGSIGVDMILGTAGKISTAYFDDFSVELPPIELDGFSEEFNSGMLRWGILKKDNNDVNASLGLIQDNPALELKSSGTGTMLLKSGDIKLADYTLEADIRSTSQNTGSIILGVHVIDDGTGYRVQWLPSGGGTIKILKYISDTVTEGPTVTNLKSKFGFDPTDGWQKLSIYAYSNTIHVFANDNDQPVIHYTDSDKPLTCGFVAVGASAGSGQTVNGYIDNVTLSVKSRYDSVGNHFYDTHQHKQSNIGLWNSDNIWGQPVGANRTISSSPEDTNNGVICLKASGTSGQEGYNFWFAGKENMSDYSFQMKINDHNSTDKYVMFFRYTSSTSYYALVWTADGRMTLKKNSLDPDDGSTTLASLIGSEYQENYIPGDHWNTVRVDVHGTKVDVYVGEIPVMVASVEDNSNPIMSGRVGYGVASKNASLKSTYFDDIMLSLIDPSLVTAVKVNKEGSAVNIMQTPQTGVDTDTDIVVDISRSVLPSVLLGMRLLDTSNNVVETSNEYNTDTHKAKMITDRVLDKYQQYKLDLGKILDEEGVLYTVKQLDFTTVEDKVSVTSEITSFNQNALGIKAVLTGSPNATGENRGSLIVAIYKNGIMVNVKSKPFNILPGASLSENFDFVSDELQGCTVRVFAWKAEDEGGSLSSFSELHIN